MQRVQTTAMRAYQNLLAAQPLTAGKVTFAWSLAAGPVLGRAASPTWTSDGTLIIRARDEAWLRELRHARPIIVERLGQLLGPDAVRRIVIEAVT